MNNQPSGFLILVIIAVVVATFSAFIQMIGFMAVPVIGIGLCLLVFVVIPGIIRS